MGLIFVHDLGDELQIVIKVNLNLHHNYEITSSNIKTEHNGKIGMTNNFNTWGNA